MRKYVVIKDSLVTFREVIQVKLDKNICERLVSEWGVRQRVSSDKLLFSEIQ